MDDLKISDMMKMQIELWEKNKDKWSPMTPEFAKDSMLWIIEELGESIAIIKKNGNEAIINNQNVRERFLEEMSDVLMYYFDTLLRYGVTKEEISKAYKEKFSKNLNRNYIYNENDE